MVDEKQIDDAIIDGDDQFVSSGIVPNNSGKVEEDVDQSAKTYCSWRFILGVFISSMATWLHIYLLRYIDLTLDSVTSCTAIIFAIILST